MRAMRSCLNGLVDMPMANAVMSSVQEQYTRAIERLPRDARPADMRILNKELSLALYASRWYPTGKNVIEMAPDLVEALDHTTLGDVKVSDIRVPHLFFWVSLHNADCGGLPGSDNRIDGAYVDATALGRMRSLQITLTTRRADINPASSADWPAKTEPYFYVPCDLAVDDTRTFEQVLDQSIRQGEIKMSEEFAHDLPMPSLADTIEGADILEVDGREMTVRWDATSRLTRVVDITRVNDLAEIERNRQAMPNVRRALSLVVNLLAYMSLAPSDIESHFEWPGDAPEELLDRARNGKSSGARHRAEEELAGLKFSRIKVVGLKHKPPSVGTEPGDGAELQFSHWRIGHFRTQVYGPKNSLRKLIWVQPVRVRPDLDTKPNAGHHYVVEPRA